MGATFRVSMLAVAWKPTGHTREKLRKEASAHLGGCIWLSGRKQAGTDIVLATCKTQQSDMETWDVSTSWQQCLSQHWAVNEWNVNFLEAF